MAKNVTLKEVLRADAETYPIPESAKSSIWEKIQQKMSEIQESISEPQTFDGDYPSFDTDVSELI